MSKTIRVQLYLNADEKIMLDKLVAEKAYRAQEFFRTKLKEAYRKEFPPYNQPKGSGEDDPYKDLSPERYCTDVLGGVVEGDVCIYTTPNGKEVEVRLSEVKKEKV